MNALLSKLQKNSTLADSAILSKSKFFTKKDMIPTPIPMLNVALSGKLDGGLTPGLTQFAGPSKHFKSIFALLLAKSYMKKYDDAVVLFYDSEFGSPKAYWETMGIDQDKVLHSPLTDIEVLTFDIMKQLVEIKRGDHVIIIIDSIGNLASIREVDNALAGSDKEDMTRAKKLKSLFRMVTPHLNLKDIPMIVVNHTYKEIGLFPKDIVGGGTGSYLSSDNIYILGRQQETEKDGKEKKVLTGYNYIINVEKSRHVKEKSKIAISVTFEDGISRYSGLLPVAVESGHVLNPVKGKYCTKTDEKTLFKEDDTNCSSFWDPILADKTFQDFVTEKYSLGTGDIISESTISSFDKVIAEAIADDE